MRRSSYLLWVAAIAAALFCALAGAVETNRVGRFDEAIRSPLHRIATPLLTLLVEKLTWLGTLGVIALFFAIAVAVMLRARRRDAALFLTVTMVGAFALENGLKLAFRRMRPPPFFGTEPLTYSFPSGHAMFSLCFYGGLAIVASRLLSSAAMKTALGTAAILLALAIGGTRIYLGVHYPSDVLAGYLVAIAWIAIVLSAEQPLSSQRPPF